MRPRPARTAAAGRRQRGVRTLGGDALPARVVLPAIGSGAVSVACGIGLLATSAWLITRASLRPPVLVLAVAIGAVQAFSLGRGLARYLQRLGVHDLSLRTLGRLRSRLYDDLEPRVPGGLPGHGSGSVLSGFVSDTERVADGVARKVTAGTDVIASVAIGTVLTGAIRPVVGLVLAAGALGTVAAPWLVVRLGRSAAVEESVVRAELADAVVDTVHSARELVAFGRRDLVVERLEEMRRRSDRAGRRRAWAAGLTGALTTWVGAAALIAVVAVGLAAHDAHHLPGVMLAVVVLASMAVLDYVAGLPAALVATADADAAARRLQQLTATGATPGSPGGRAGWGDRSRAPTGAGPARAREGRGEPSQRGAGRLVEASVASPHGPILRHVSLAVAPQRRVALTGASGSGKTTVIHALLGFTACSCGTASLGGDDVRDLTRPEIATRAGWLADETHVFAASLGDNLRIARPPASDRSCCQALRRAGLGGWYDSLPAGLDTVLGQGGRSMSAGERQRLGLARVILRAPPLLLLDEPTSHLDPASAPAVLAEMLGACGDRSVLVVSHQPDIDRYVDEVVTLDRGEVVRAPSGPR